ncbi:glutamate racemase [Marinifilum caeruleilacunae]|uniref:Glutamate racemase n=1 Tax=Marinifilum caeruleilacunae TaxID=2499076 RepID=A0ABX1X035_9BACT|nr:glutamate racemase [Marinifilum caeruleilacunae]NOU61445.1 glutamate racemase [Marinifilum caeruleilacunae]
MITKKQAIGVFDSGYGGLTILNELLKELPEYDFIYLGDNARSPYGTRSYDVVYDYTLEAVEQLFSMNCELVILACNTASAKALRTIQQRDLPKISPNKRVLGVIRPSVEEVGLLTKTKHVGILGTVGTVRSNSYPLEIEKLHPEINVVQEACPMWVPLVENNEFASQGGQYFIKKNIENLLQKDPKIDTIILGCTHYPLLKEEIRKYLPSGVNLISQGEIVAKSLKDYLRRHPEMDVRCSKNSEREFYTTEFVDSFEEKASRFLNTSLKAEHINY